MTEQAERPEYTGPARAERVIGYEALTEEIPGSDHARVITNTPANVSAIFDFCDQVRTDQRRHSVMKRREFSKLMGAAAIAPVLRPMHGLAEEPRAWSLVADVAECCSCDIPCSCNFGRPEALCHGSRLIRIREGQLDGADLAGLRFVVTFFMGRWTRIYIDESLSQAQSATLDRLLPVAFAGFDRGARVKERVPLTIERGAGTFRFSVPESTVEMKLLPGLGGEPIRITGLPSTAYQDYVQYESVVHTHNGPDETWSYSGTNGFQSVMRASG